MFNKTLINACSIINKNAFFGQTLIDACGIINKTFVRGNKR